MAVLAETSRLIVRDWHPAEDAEQALQIYSDPEVTKFLITKADNIQKQTCILHRWVERTLHPGDRDSFWAVVSKNTKEIVGTIILLQLIKFGQHKTQNYEIGWHFKQSAWGKGYATEAAQAVLSYGFNQLKLPVIYAVVNPENTASIRVTQRLKMQPLGRTNEYYGSELELFVLEAHRWRELSQSN